MTDTTDRLTRWREHAKAAFKKVPNSRHYAADAAALDAPAALVCVWHELAAARAAEDRAREQRIAAEVRLGAKV